MADWGDFFGGGDTAFGYDSFTGGGGSWTDWFSGGGGSDLIDIGTDILNSDGGDSNNSWWQSLFGGGSGGSGSGSNSSLWTSLLGGLGGAAQGYLSGKDLKEGIEARGREDRRTAGYTAELADFYRQKDKVRKRTALDTYGQFSLAGNISSPGIDLPNKPSP